MATGTRLLPFPKAQLAGNAGGPGRSRYHLLAFVTAFQRANIGSMAVRSQIVLYRARDRLYCWSSRVVVQNGRGAGSTLSAVALLEIVVKAMQRRQPAESSWGGLRHCLCVGFALSRWRDQAHAWLRPAGNCSRCQDEDGAAGRAAKWLALAQCTCKAQATCPSSTSSTASLCALMSSANHSSSHTTRSCRQTERVAQHVSLTVAACMCRRETERR